MPVPIQFRGPKPADIEPQVLAYIAAHPGQKRRQVGEALFGRKFGASATASAVGGLRNRNLVVERPSRALYVTAAGRAALELAEALEQPADPAAMRSADAEAMRLLAAALLPCDEVDADA